MLRRIIHSQTATAAVRMIAVLAAMVLTTIWSDRAMAQAFCGPSITACDLQQDQLCLERVLACGEYDTIIATLFAEDVAPSLDQKFALGAAYFGNHVRARATGVQCRAVVKGREWLRDYLGTVDTEFRQSASFGTLAQMRQIYHATQMLGELDQVGGCPESALTRARVQAIAAAEATQFARAIFLTPPDAVADVMGTLNIALRTFVSQASDLETGIALRRIEIEAAGRVLGNVRGLFDEVFGGVSGEGAALRVDSAVLEQLMADGRPRLRRVENREDAFRVALGGFGPADYAEVRTETVRTAQGFLKESAFHINMIGVLMPTDPARPFPQLEGILGADSPANAARDALSLIRADWRALGDANGNCMLPNATERVWYCR